MTVAIDIPYPARLGAQLALVDDDQWVGAPEGSLQSLRRQRTCHLLHELNELVVVARIHDEQGATLHDDTLGQFSGRATCRRVASSKSGYTLGL